MTISTITRTKQYNGNNSTTVFAYDFNIQADSELEVYLGTPVGAPTTWTLQTITTHFSISNAGVAGGGDVTFVTAPPTGVGNVYMRRVTAKTQASNYVENDPFSANTVENNLDKLTQIQQDMQEEIDRCFKLGSIVPDAGTTEASSVVADRKDKLFAFDSSGDFSVTSEIGTVKGNWAASTAYVLRDIVKDTNNNNIYICITAHTSSGAVPISTNTDAAKWSLLVDAASATTSAAAAATSATAAATSATTATAKSVLTAADVVSTNADVVLTNADVVLAEAAKASAEGATGALAFKFTFDSSTTMADPGTGELRLNHGTVASVTAIAFDAVSADTSNPDVSDYIASWDDGTNSTHEGYITIRKSGTPATYAVFSLTGAVTDSTGYLTAVVTHVDSNGTWTNGDTMYVSFARSGDKGATGSTGSTGSTGATGPGASGLHYQFETATADSDQGAGKVWLNHATVASATILYIDNDDNDGTDVSAFTATWDDSSATSDKGFIKIQARATPTDYAIFKLSATGTDNTAYWEFPVTHLVSAGTFSDTEVVDVFFTRSGDSGGVANRTVDTMTGDGSDTTLALSQSPGSTNNCTCFIDGVGQHPGTDFNISGSTLTFTTAPALSTVVVAICGGNESIGTPSDGTVTNVKVHSSAAIATSKLSGAVTSIPSHGLGALASLATVGTTQIDNDSVTGAKLNPALVAGDVIYADGTDTINRLAKPATPAGEVLTFATSATAPSWVAPAGGGKLLSCIQTQLTSKFTTTSGSMVDITGLSVATGTRVATSKILVVVQLNWSNSGTGGHRNHWQLMRDSTAIAIGDVSGSQQRDSINMAQSRAGEWSNNSVIYWLDDVSGLGTTTTITYKLKGYANAATLQVNASASDANSANEGAFASSITVQEIGA
jgi:hypothetical protein